jgi:DNA-directed RNA polymerase subunit H (RpoH/RPB5)
MSTSNNISSSGLITSIYNSRKVILDLMKEQGYNVDGYDNFSINEVSAMKQHNQLDMLLEKKNANPETKRKNKIYIRYYLGKTIRPSNINEMIDDLFNLEETLTKEDTLFIVTKEEINDTMINELKHIWEKDKIFVIMQHIKRLQFNILQHVLVPKHRVMKKDEVQTVMKKYNLMEISQFPDISRFDPVAIAIGIRPGEVCHILRPSKTAVLADYYRVCI